MSLQNANRSTLFFLLFSWIISITSTVNAQIKKTIDKATSYDVG